MYNNVAVRSVQKKIQLKLSQVGHLEDQSLGISQLSQSYKQHIVCNQGVKISDIGLVPQFNYK